MPTECALIDLFEVIFCPRPGVLSLCHASGFFSARITCIVMLWGPCACIVSRVIGRIVAFNHQEFESRGSNGRKEYVPCRRRSTVSVTAETAEIAPPLRAVK